jgi:hypothetical protein
MRGYIMLQRKFFSHWLWEEERAYNRPEAFLDLLQLAAFAPTKRVVQGKLVSLNVGELVASERFLEIRWKWSRTKVRQFLEILEKDQMLDRRKDQRETVLILCNYKDYQTAAEAKKTTDQTNDNTTDQTKEEPSGNHQRTIGEPNKKKDKKREEGKELIPPPTPAAKPPTLFPTEELGGGGWEDSRPTHTAERIAKLQSRINSLHPSWRKRPHFAAKELHALNDNLTAWMDLSEDDWHLLAAYMAEEIPEDWRKHPADFLQPDSRVAAINMAPSGLLSYADRWKLECKKRGITINLEPIKQTA